MHTVSAVFIVHIFMIHSIGIAGITMPTTTIPFITLHGIIHPGRLDLDGATAGIHHTQAGAGVIRLGIVTGTVLIMADTMADITEDTMAVLHGTDMQTTGISIRIIMYTGKDVLPVQVLHMVIMDKEEQPTQQYAVHQPLQKVAVKE